LAVLFHAPKSGRTDPENGVYIDRLEPPEKGRRIVTDTHREAPKGFALRVNADGSKSFVLRYAAGGWDRLLTIGRYPTWTLTAARIQAREYRRRIDAGEDILGARHSERAEPTVSDVAHRFFQHKADLRSAGDIRAVLRHYLLAELGQRRLTAVRRRDVIALVERIADSRPRQAALLLTYTKQLFAWAEDRELIEANPVATLKPARIHKALAPRARTRVLDNDELKAFWQTADTCGLHRLTALALKLVLVTGQRPGEVTGMHWDEIDGRLWTIPGARRGKTETAHTVPLTETAEAILDDAKAEVARLTKRRRAKPSGYVFETRPGQCLTSAGLSRAVNRYADRLGSKRATDGGRWTPHDLRRTMRTHLSAAGVSEMVAELAIGHTRKGIAAVYDLHTYDREKRAALEAWERRLARLIAGEPADEEKVVPLAPRQPAS